MEWENPFPQDFWSKNQTQSLQGVVAGVMYQRLIFVFKEVALQMMLFAGAGSTVLSSQWVFPSLLPLFSVVSLTPPGFFGNALEHSVGLDACRAGLSGPLGPSSAGTICQIPRRGGEMGALGQGCGHSTPALPRLRPGGNFVLSPHPRRIPAPLPPRGSQPPSKC